MIGWVEPGDEGETTLTLFDSRLNVLARLTEIDDSWVVEDFSDIERHITTMLGRGCPTPVEFLMTLISPRNSEEPEGPHLTFQNDTEKWEIWEVK